jgi:tRNA(adenine34) deaminase
MHMSHEYFMKIAIKAAKESEKQGGCPTGAVIVKDGRVISKGISMVASDNDPSQHSEMVAIREASKKLGALSHRLEGCVMYSTVETCSMCLGAALWANLKAIYFGAYATDIAGNDYEFKNYSLEERAENSQLWDGSKIQITGGILRDECKELMKDYKNWSKQA